MTKTQNSRIRQSAAYVLLILILAAALFTSVVAAENTLAINTDGLIGKTTDTILVPIIISTTGQITAYQFDINSGDTDTAKITYYTESVLEAGANSGEKTVYWYTLDKTNYLTGTKTLLYLAVTPKVEGEISLDLSNVYIYEVIDGKRTEVPYTIQNGNLTVNGIGTGNTIGEQESGATMIYGAVGPNGTFTTGSKTGICTVALSKTRTGYIIIYYGSMGIYEPPENIGYMGLYDIASDAPAGEPISISFGVAETELTNKGKTAEDLFVLHNINGTWYKSIITDPVLTNGVYAFTANTWASATTFLIGYDTNSTEFTSETQDIALGKTSSLPILPIAIGIIGLIALFAVIAVVKRRKN